jgi:hypothetical protein
MLPGWLIQTGLRRECVVVAVQLEPRRTVAAFSDVLHQLPEDSSDLAVTIKHDLHMIAPVVRPGQLCLKVGQARRKLSADSKLRAWITSASIPSLASLIT